MFCIFIVPLTCLETTEGVFGEELNRVRSLSSGLRGTSREFPLPRLISRWILGLLISSTHATVGAAEWIPEFYLVRGWNRRDWNKFILTWSACHSAPVCSRSEPKWQGHDDVKGDGNWSDTLTTVISLSACGDQRTKICLWHQRNHRRASASASSSFTHTPSLMLYFHCSQFKVIGSFINALRSCVDMETVLMINLEGKSRAYTRRKEGNQWDTFHPGILFFFFLELSRYQQFIHDWFGEMSIVFCQVSNFTLQWWAEALDAD